MAPAAVGQNPRAGVLIPYFLKDVSADGVTIEILDRSGRSLRSFRSGENASGAAAEERRAFLGAPPSRVSVPTEAGLNRFEWDMRMPDASLPPAGTNLFGGSIRGPLVVPGTYQVRLTAAGRTLTQPFEIVKDPRSPATAQDFERQFALLAQIQTRLSETHDAIADIIEARKDVQATVARAARTPAAARIAGLAKSLDAGLGSVQDELVQMNIKDGNDVLSYPAKLNNLLAALASAVAQNDAAPTAQAEEVFTDLSARLDRQLTRLGEIVDRDVAAFNKLVEDQHIPAIAMKPRAKKTSSQK